MIKSFIKYKNMEVDSIMN